MEYPEEWEKRRVSPGGQMKWDGWKVQVSHALVNQLIGLEPVEDGLWRIYFGSLELGQFDERKRRVLPIKRLPEDRQR